MLRSLAFLAATFAITLGSLLPAALVRQSLVVDEAGKAAGTVAALLHLRAIGVKEAVAKVHIRPWPWRDHQQLVEAHAEMPIGQGTDVFW